MDVLLSSSEGTVARITLNRPEKRNALNSELLLALRQEFARLKTDSSIKVIT